LWLCGVLGQQFAINRLLLQDIQYMLRKHSWDRPIGEEFSQDRRG
jgi:hypothetical protein